MAIATFAINNTIRVLNAEHIIQTFGLQHGEVPIIEGGVWTPGADSIQLSLAFNKDFLGTEANLSDKLQVNYEPAGGGSAVSFLGLLLLGAAASSQTQGISVGRPFQLNRQLAMLTNNAAQTIVSLFYFKAPGGMMKRSDLEKLADRRRMVYAPGPGVPGHIMNAGLRNRMGDTAGGF